MYENNSEGEPGFEISQGVNKAGRMRGYEGSRGGTLDAVRKLLQGDS